MAECITSSSPSYCPQVKLVVTESTHDDISFTFAWTLSYVGHGYALYTDGAARSYTVKIDGELAKSGSRDINGVTGTIQLASGTYKVSKHSKARDVSFSCSFDFNATFSKVAMGTRTASGSYSIPATTSYTVSYYANDGSGAPSAQTKWHSVALTLSTTKPTRTGYTFVDWVATNGTHYNPGDSFTQNNNSTLTAQWKKITYSVTYNANGGSGAPSNQTKTYGTNLTLSSTKPTRTGYTFAGWNTNSSGTGTNYAAGATYTSNAALTLYAKWTLITYKVTYNANGGSGAPSQQTKNYGQTLTLSSTKPTKTNYNFMGWATSATGSVAYTSGASYTTNAAVTLYAVWEQASDEPVISNLAIVRKRIDGIDIIDDPLNGDMAVVDFDYIFDSNTHGDEAYYTISSKTTKTYLPYDEDFSTKASGHRQFIIQPVTNLVDSVLYLTIVDMNGLSATKSIRLNAGKYRMDYFDDDEVGVSVGMPASQPGFHVNPEATFHNHIHMKPDDPEVEADIFFETGSGGSHEHRASIYGSCSDSETAIGMWDNKNSRAIMLYRDAQNEIYIGNTEGCAVIKRRKVIPSGTDLNTIIAKPGHYVCAANTTVATLTNCPTTNAFQLDVWPSLNETNGGTYMLAELTTYKGAKYVNIRNTSWSGWICTQFINDSWKTQDKVSYKRDGNWVYVNCYYSGSTNIVKDAIITAATLPDGYRPTLSNHHAIGHVSGSGNGVCNVTVYTNGKITVEPQIACKQYDFSTVFLIK